MCNWPTNLPPSSESGRLVGHQREIGGPPGGSLTGHPWEVGGPLMGGWWAAPEIEFGPLDSCRSLSAASIDAGDPGVCRPGGCAPAPPIRREGAPLASPWRPAQGRRSVDRRRLAHLNGQEGQRQGCRVGGGGQGMRARSPTAVGPRGGEGQPGHSVMVQGAGWDQLRFAAVGVEPVLLAEERAAASERKVGTGRAGTTSAISPHRTRPERSPTVTLRPER